MLAVIWSYDLFNALLVYKKALSCICEVVSFKNAKAEGARKLNSFIFPQ